jgi:hypothetical protein
MAILERVIELNVPEQGLPVAFQRDDALDTCAKFWFGFIDFCGAKDIELQSSRNVARGKTRSHASAKTLSRASLRVALLSDWLWIRFQLNPLNIFRVFVWFQTS